MPEVQQKEGRVDFERSALSLAQLTTNRDTIGEAKAPKLKAGGSNGSSIIKGANYVLLLSVAFANFSSSN